MVKYCNSLECIVYVCCMYIFQQFYPVDCFFSAHARHPETSDLVVFTPAAAPSLGRRNSQAVWADESHVFLMAGVECDEETSNLDDTFPGKMMSKRGTVWG